MVAGPALAGLPGGSVACRSSPAGAPRLGFTHGTPPMLLLLIIPIMFAAYLGGLRAGLLATVLAALASDYFLLSPRHSLWIDHPANRIQWVMLWVVGLMISLLCEALHRSRERLVQDITDRKRAEEQRQQFVSLAENSHEFIGMSTRSSGRSLSTKRGCGWLDWITWSRPCGPRSGSSSSPKIRPSSWMSSSRKCCGTAMVRSRSASRHFQTGEPLWMIYAVFALADATGKPSGFATVSRNISERKRAEEELAGPRRIGDAVRSGRRTCCEATPNWNRRNKRPKPPAAQEHIPGQHEPRDPHPPERGHRHDGTGPQEPVVRPAARVPDDRQGFGRSPALGDQRHPRLLQDRGGEARAGQHARSTCGKASATR